MRVLLTADWRLGRAFHGRDLLAEQTSLIDQVVAAARQRRVDAVVLAGGLLDPFASEQARELLEHAFARLVQDEGVPVLALCPEAGRPAGWGLLARLGLHLVGVDSDPAAAIELSDEHGPVFVQALPACERAEDFGERFEEARAAVPKGARSLLVGRLPESGDEGLPSDRSWKSFAAACLGGRRTATELVSGRAWVAGMPLPWDFDDADSPRGLSLIEIDAKGRAKLESLPLNPLRALRRVEGRAAELAELPESSDCVRLVVTDPGLLTSLGALRERWPGLLETDRPEPDGEGPTLVELFARYHEEVEGRGLSDAERALLDSLELPATPAPSGDATGWTDSLGEGWCDRLAQSVHAGDAAALELRLEDLLLEVEGRADVVRLNRAEALTEASAQLAEEDGEELTLEELGERREEARLRLDAARATAEHLAHSAEHARELLETARARQMRLDELARARDRLRAAETRVAEIGLLKRELERAEAAAALAKVEKKQTDRKALKARETASATLREVEEKRVELQRERDEAELALDRARQASEEALRGKDRLAELDDLEGVVALLEKTRASLSESEGRAKSLQARRAAAAASLGDVEARAKAAEGALERARAALGDEGASRLEELRQALEDSVSQLDALRRLDELQTRRKEVTKSHATTMIHLDRARRSQDTELRQLQRRLSGDGPAPDEQEIEAQRVLLAGLEEEVKQLEQEQAGQESAVQELGAEVLHLRQELGNLAYSDVEELARSTDSLRAELEEAGAPAETLAKAETEAAALADQRESLQAELGEAETELRLARAKEESERDLAGELETRLPVELRTREALAAERESIEAELARSSEALALAGTRADAAKDALAEVEDACAAARDRLMEADAVLARSQSELLALAHEAGFADLGDYQDAKREPARRKEAKSRLVELETELREARAAHRELEGLTNVPVLRDGDRGDFEQEEWERRQRERRQALQSTRVHTDRDLLAGLLEQLESEREHALAETERLEDAWQAIASASASTLEFAEELAGLRERHETLSRLTDLAAGRLGPAAGFAGWLDAATGEEAKARAGTWCRRLTGGELHLAVEGRDGSSSVMLREVHGRSVRGSAEWAPEERWLTGLCLALGAADAVWVRVGAAACLDWVVDSPPSGLAGSAADRAATWLEALRSSVRRVDLAGAERASRGRRRRAAADRAG